MQLSVIPTFLAEISPANFRGSAGSLYWLAIKVGGLVVTGIVRGTSNIKGNPSWQIPIGIIFIIPAFVLVLVWFTPEVRYTSFPLHRFHKYVRNNSFTALLLTGLK